MSRRASALLFVLPLLLSLPLLTLPLSLPPRALRRDRSQGRVILPTTYGGTGNQLYFLLEAIHLAHATNSSLLLPPPPPRNLPNRSATPPSHNLDVALLETLLPVARGLPRHCENSFQHLVLAHRTPRPPPVSARALAVACHYVVPPRPCHALSRAAVHTLHLPLSRRPSPLRALLPSLSGCILLDGHSFNAAGEPAHEALHSYLHYLRPDPAIRALAAPTRPDLVLHLRHDEHQCRPPGPAPRVCLRLTLSTAAGVVRWVEPTAFSRAIVAEARARGLRTLYLAFSPYVPPPVVARLSGLLATGLTLLPRVRFPDHETENLVERQIATDARLFVGDFGSTWSGTVYYKRRTMARPTVWACRLLRMCDDLAYYRFDGVLRTPDVFRRAGVI